MRLTTSQVCFITHYINHILLAKHTNPSIVYLTVMIPWRIINWVNKIGLRVAASAAAWRCIQACFEHFHWSLSIGVLFFTGNKARKRPKCNFTKIYQSWRWSCGKLGKNSRRKSYEGNSNFLLNWDPLIKIRDLFLLKLECNTCVMHLHLFSQNKDVHPIYF